MRMWLGDTDAREDADCWPLREIVSLCGLTLGGDQPFEDRQERRSGGDGSRQAPRRLKLATFCGVVTEEYEQVQQVVDRAERFDQKRRRGR
ncbi:hypothetical protein [Brevundimonas sp. SPF441]|uniref:hypothetical protein n=1 Tax=Brevundimonas sp. SPF441 TaxID=2663795 RepID=UPI00129EF35F|nr:hypothetical protein [Brevundimonas sp. SPF441]MRL69874.1 hypothetical protein [Brevundimonas sp. SPF441]